MFVWKNMEGFGVSGSVTGAIACQTYMDVTQDH